MQIETFEELTIVRDALNSYAQSHKPDAAQSIAACQLVEDCDAELGFSESYSRSPRGLPHFSPEGT